MTQLDKTIFGLDISDRALRLAKFEKKGKKLVLASYNELDLPADIIVTGEIIDEEGFINGVKQLVKTAKGKKIRSESVIAVLPETRTFIKVIKVGAAKNEEELLALITEEIKNHIPLSAEEIYLDWQILSAARDHTKVLVGAAPRNIIDSYFSALERSGFTPYVLEIEAAAICRGLIATADEKSKIIIDFGANRTGLIIYDENAPQFTITLPISGNKITETIAQKLQLDLDKAEQAKIICGLDPNKCEGALLKILVTTVESIAKEIKKAMLYYKTISPAAKPISEIVICGGGGNFANMDKVLADKLKIPVVIGNPFINASQGAGIALPANKILSYTSAIGLALREFQKKS